MQLILISGLSGSGKSVALRSLEDAGFFCVDNLPATMLADALTIYQADGYQKVAISVDTRSRATLDRLPAEIGRLRSAGLDVRLFFFEAKRETLVKRFSETRRAHPLAGMGLTLAECIELERELLAAVGELGLRVDTSDMAANNLRQWVRELAGCDGGRLTLMFESFGFKHGVPLDADFVFDVRCLPNPHYVAELRPLTGRDQPVIDFFAHEAQVAAMIADIRAFIEKWLPEFVRENRSYLSVAIGCTGGQHRSVYIAEHLARAFGKEEQVQLRHRQLQRAACD